jgi:hypothetical protein
MQASHADSPLIVGLPTRALRAAEHIPHSNAGTNLPNANHAINSLGKTPIKVHNLSTYLFGYSEKSFLINGFLQGFELQYNGPRFYRESKKFEKCNYKP